MIDPDLLLEAYRLGVFPMAMDNGEIRWFSPEPRTILPLDTFHVPHGLKRERRAQAVEIRINTSFLEVMQGCAARADTWINDEIIESYTRLHELGSAHSVEVWSANELVGGLYGVAIGGAFFGESMFHRTHRRVQDRALGAGRASARAPVYLARYAMAHAAPGAIRRARNSAAALPASAQRGARFAAHFSGD